MTLHWWMHWFWITYQFTYCVFLTNSLPLSPASTTPSDLEIEHNRPLRRPIKSIDQITKSHVSISLPFPDTSDTSDITIGLSESLAQLYKTKTTLNPDKTLCLNNITLQKNSTSGIKNETYYLCSKKIIKSNDNLTISTEPPVDTTELSTENTTSGLDNFTSIITNNNNTLESVIVTKEILSAKVSDTENISTSSNLTAVSITGISFGVLIFAAFIGVTSFVLYRRRYLNKPQTLNDKCSNPDSSGYIDDSTMRENSEEMYSLDNDSFLNSIEAMTIQNYWTDSVKHTKL